MFHLEWYCNNNSVVFWDKEARARRLYWRKTVNKGYTNVDVYTQNHNEQYGYTNVYIKDHSEEDWINKSA